MNIRAKKKIFNRGAWGYRRASGLNVKCLGTMSVYAQAGTWVRSPRTMFIYIIHMYQSVQIFLIKSWEERSHRGQHPSMQLTRSFSCETWDLSALTRNLPAARLEIFQLLFHMTSTSCETWNLPAARNKIYQLWDLKPTSCDTCRLCVLCTSCRYSAAHHTHWRVAIWDGVEV